MIFPLSAAFALNPVALVVAGAWRWILGVLLAGALGVWIALAAYRHGVDHERATWTARAAQATARAATDSHVRALAKDGAQRAASHRAESYARTRMPIAREVIRYVQTPAAAVACPDVAGVRVGTAAIAAANAALAAR